MRKFFAAALLILALAGCGRSHSGSPEAENKIRIAVFEYQMGQYNAASYFLSIGEAAGDPSAEIMQHFAGRTPPVKPASQGTVGGGAGLSDLQSGDSGVMLKAAAINWISDTEVEVKGGYFAGAKSATGNTYHLTLKDGEWAVDKDTVDWKS